MAHSIKVQSDVMYPTEDKDQSEVMYPTEDNPYLMATSKKKIWNKPHQLCNDCGVFVGSTAE